MSFNTQMPHFEKNSSKFDPILHYSNSIDGLLPASPSFLDASIPIETEPSIDLSLDDLPLDSSFFNDELFSQFEDSFLEKCDLDNSTFSTDALDPIQQLLQADLNMLKDRSNSVSTEQYGSTEVNTNTEASYLPIAVSNSTVSTDSMSEDSEQDQSDRNSYVLHVRTTAKWTRFGSKKVLKYSDEYHYRRSRNNNAVKKTREKAKEKEKEKQLKMTMLINENEKLKNRLDDLAREIDKLKTQR